jgi:hypothetical protein
VRVRVERGRRGKKGGVKERGKKKTGRGLGVKERGSKGWRKGRV